MPKTININAQSYSELIKNNHLFVDKTALIKEWWENGSEVTVITRPRGFGKTLAMNMVNCFFSNHFKNRDDLFEGLEIYKEEKYRKLQGTYPVIYLSFSSVKMPTYEQARIEINRIITEVFNQFRYILNTDLYTQSEINSFNQINEKMGISEAANSIHLLCQMLQQYDQKKVIILLDDFDIPMLEAYANGYWNDLSILIRAFFLTTFKTNRYMHRAIMIGSTNVISGNILSDLNNVEIIMTTSKNYANAFGFTEKEVFDLLEEYGLEGLKDEVKRWYCGFVFGNTKDIYHPYSIINLLKYKQFEPYWTNISDDHLISKLCKESNINDKKDLELLLLGKTIHVSFDEQVIFYQSDTIFVYLWSFMLATGYIKIEKEINDDGYLSYDLSLTNHEVRLAMITMIEKWFNHIKEYHLFLEYLLDDDLVGMNKCMNYLTFNMMRSFDRASSKRVYPSNFYHGFVLGLIANLENQYEISSNLERIYERYDIMLKPKNHTKPGISIEFKVIDKDEYILDDYSNHTLKHINNHLLRHSMKEIRKYTFAFYGKEVKIVKGESL